MQGECSWNTTTEARGETASQPSLSSLAPFLGLWGSGGEMTEEGKIFSIGMDGGLLQRIATPYICLLPLPKGYMWYVTLGLVDYGSLFLDWREKVM